MKTFDTKNELQDLIGELSLLCFIKLTNNFTNFFTSPETRKWRLEVEPTNHRGKFFRIEGPILKDLILQALLEINDEFYTEDLIVNQIDS